MNYSTSPNCRTGWNKRTGRNFSKIYLPYRCEIVVQGGIILQIQDDKSLFYWAISKLLPYFVTFDPFDILFVLFIQSYCVKLQLFYFSYKFFQIQLPYRTLIRAYRVEIFSKNHKRTCTAIRESRVKLIEEAKIRKISWWHVTIRSTLTSVIT